MREVGWLSDDDQATWRAVLRASVVLLDRLDAELEGAHGLTLADYEILVVLSEAPEQRLRMSELADRALLSRPRLTRRADRLAARGLVRRERCPTDRRGAYAVLTAAGRRALERAAPTHVAGVRRYVVDPVDGPTRAALRRGTTAIADAVEASGRPDGRDGGDG